MNAELRKKIVDLFEYRQLPLLMELGQGTVDMEFYEHLLQLQAAIYHLDHELETMWDVPMRLIDDRWAAIHLCLSTLGVPVACHDNYCRHIYKYQRHELELREQRFPMRLSMEYFYFYKSCDVKLLRKLIYDRYPSLHKEVKLSEWRVFDLITEIDDDVEDIYEDMHTINGNRFLLSLLIHGKEKTADTYQSYLSELGTRANTVRQPLSRRMSVTVYKQTQQLLAERLAAYDGQQLSQALICKYIKPRLAVGES